MNAIYCGDFTSIEDIENEFNQPGCLDGCEVLFAVYDYDGYHGLAVVIYRDSDGVIQLVAEESTPKYTLEGEKKIYEWEESKKTSKLGTKWKPGEAKKKDIEEINFHGWDDLRTNIIDEIEK